MSLNLVDFGPFDLMADDATGAIADELLDHAPGTQSSVIRFTLEGQRPVEVEYVPQEHRSGYGYLTAMIGDTKEVHTFRWQDGDKRQAEANMGAAVANYLIGDSQD